MKEKNKKRFFGLFQSSKNSDDSSQENLTSSSEEENKHAADQSITEETSNNQSPAPAATSHDNETASKKSAFWDYNDPLVVKIDEEILQIECNQFISKMRSLSAVFKRTTNTQQEPEPKAAQPQLYISKNRMLAWLYVIPPLNNGPDITENDLRAILSRERVTAGIIEEALKSIVETPIYDQVVLIAKGTLARNGVDGSIKDIFKRSVQLEFEEDEKGSVDYKKLNNVQFVKEGEVICEIIPAIPGENGVTVTGQPYPCTIKGKEATVPAGRNTVLTDDHTLLISQKSGHITFANGKFQVEPVLKINGNVDNNTGNLDYEGDIFITGDVRNGFSIKATGCIDIRGSVEGAQITAHGPITIASGVSGNGRGSLTSDSDVKCRYLEHCTVYAGGSVYAESIINSKVESSLDVVVTSGIGVIIGGSILASNNITARIIGSKVRRLITELIIATVPKDVEEGNKLNRELEQLRHNMAEIRKNITYLESAQRKDKELLLQNLKQASDILTIREKEINERLEEITVDADSVQTGLIQCQQLLPVARVRIGSSSLLIQEEYSKSIIYKNSEGEVVIGSN